MAVPRIVLDGTMAYGVTVGASGTVTINSIAYVVISVTPTRNVQVARDYVADGGVGRSRYTADFDQVQLELQLATSSTVVPQFGQTFAMTLDANYGSETWVVQPNSAAQSNEANSIRTCTVTCEKVYASVTTVN